MKQLLFLDLDRTLIATDDFMDYVADVLAQQTGNSHDEMVKLLHKYSEAPQDHLRHTDFNRLLNDLSLDKTAVNVAVRAAIPPDSLLLPDARSFLDWAKQQKAYEVHILSFGQTDFQQLKLDACPALVWLPASIIQQRKYQYIADHFAGRVGVLIDDKPDQALPPGWQEIHIDRRALNMHKPRQLSDGVWQITTLGDATSILQVAP